MLQFIALAKLSFADFQDEEKPRVLFSAASGPSLQRSLQPPAPQTALPALPTSYLLPVVQQTAPPDPSAHNGATSKRPHRSSSSGSSYGHNTI